MRQLKPSVYKIIIILLLSISIVIFYKYSQNGRYQLHSESKTILDTRTGTIYLFNTRGRLLNYNNPIEQAKKKTEK